MHKAPDAFCGLSFVHHHHPPQKKYWTPNPKSLKMWPFWIYLLKMKSLARNPVPMTAVLKKRGNLDTNIYGGAPHEDEGRDHGDASTSQRMPKIVGKPPETRQEVHNAFSLITLRRNRPCWHLDLGLVASRMMRKHFCCLSHPVSGTLLWQPKLTNKAGKPSLNIS